MQVNISQLIRRTSEDDHSLCGSLDNVASFHKKYDQ